MKKGVFLVNCARGGIVVEKDLIAALDDGTVRGAGIDVIAALIESQNQESLAFFRSLGYIHDERVEYVSTRRCGES